MRTARRFVFPIVGAASCAAMLHSYAEAGWFSFPSVWDTVASWLLVTALVVSMAGGLVLQRLRPSNASGPVMFALGATMAVWGWALPTHHLLGWYAKFSLILFRPLLFWLVLGWPYGRLPRPDRRWLLGYSALLVVFWGSPILVQRRPVGENFENPLAVRDYARFVAACASLGNIVLLPIGAIAVIAAVIRRHRRLPAATRTVNRWAVTAGVLAGAGDLVLVVVNRFLGDYTSGAHGRRLLGGVVAVFDIGRFAITPLLLLIVAGLAAHRQPAARREVEIGPVQARVGPAIAAALGDESARVAYFDDGHWYDGDGEPVVVGGPGRSVAVVERGGVPVAAVEHDIVLDDRPTTVEVAVAAAASLIEADRLAAIAESRAREALAARRAIVELEDSTRRQVERDLHDGAQQQLVGLAIHANLAARDADPDVWSLAAGVVEARAQLRSFAGGGLPPLLAEQGLGAAIASMAEAAPVAIDVDVSLPFDLPPAIAATGWFVVAEAVTNAVKYGHASRVTVHGRCADALVISVIDDGRGGATFEGGSGLRGLAERARACGGTLEIDSPPGAGTAVLLQIPVPR